MGQTHGLTPTAWLLGDNPCVKVGSVAGAAHTQGGPQISSLSPSVFHCAVLLI